MTTHTALTSKKLLGTLLLTALFVVIFGGISKVYADVLPGAADVSGTDSDNVFVESANKGADVNLNAPESWVSVSFTDIKDSPATVAPSIRFDDGCFGTNQDQGGSGTCNRTSKEVVFYIYTINANGNVGTLCKDGTFGGTIGPNDQVGSSYVLDNGWGPWVDISACLKQGAVDNTTNMSGVLIESTLSPSDAVNAFKIQANSASGKALVGYADKGNSDGYPSAIQNRDTPAQDPNGGPSTGVQNDFTINMRQACDGSSAEPLDLEWQDADAGPKGVPEDDDIYWSVKVTDQQGNVKIQTNSVARANGETSLTNPAMTPGTTAFKNALNATKNWNYLGGNGAREEVNFGSVQQGDSIVWTWHNVRRTNGIQVFLHYNTNFFNNSAFLCNQNPPVGRIYSVQCSYIIADAYDPDNGKHVAGTSDGNAVYIKVITGDGTQLLDNKASATPATPLANDVWTNAAGVTDPWDEKNPPANTTPYYGVSDEYDGTGTNTWADFLSKHTGDTDVTLRLYAMDNQSNQWVLVNTTTGFDASSCVPAGTPPHCTLAPTIGSPDVEVNTPFQVKATINFNSGTATAPTAQTPVTVTPILGAAESEPLGGWTKITSRVETAITSAGTPFSISVAADAPATASVTIGGVSYPCSGTISLADFPYFKAYDGDVTAGGGVAADDGTCNSSGEIDAFNEGPTGEDGPGGGSGKANAGSGTQLLAGASATSSFIAGFVSGDLRASDPESPKGLTIANDPTATTGTYGGESGLNDCVTFAEPTGSTVQSTYNNETTGTFDINGNVNISNGLDVSNTSTTGDHLVLYVKGNVEIGDDIDYLYANSTSGAHAWNGTNIPSVEIIATGSIYISNNVSQLDGLYISKGGTIYTCASPDAGGLYQPAALNELYSQCNNQLTVNGAFVANTVQLMRSYGTLRDANTGELEATVRNDCTNDGSIGANTTCAGEVFNLSPELYLTNTNNTLQPLQFDSITSLPPVL